MTLPIKVSPPSNDHTFEPVYGNYLRCSKCSFVIGYNGTYFQNGCCGSDIENITCEQRQLRNEIREHKRKISLSRWINLVKTERIRTVTAKNSPMAEYILSRVNEELNK